MGGVRRGWSADVVPAPEYWLVTPGGQQLLLPAAERFLRRVTWVGDVAAAWAPHEDPASPVRVDPELRFARPQVDGISTEALWHQTEAGEAVEDLAETFGLTVDAVRWALAYEHSARSGRPAAA